MINPFLFRYGKAVFFRRWDIDSVCSTGLTVFDSPPLEIEMVKFDWLIFFADVVAYIIPCMGFFLPKGFLEEDLQDVAFPSTGEVIFSGVRSHNGEV